MVSWAALACHLLLSLELRLFHLKIDRAAPTDAVYVNLFLRLSSPDNGVREIAFDDLRLIEWSADARTGPAYDHLAVDGSARLTVTAHDEEIQWETVDGDPVV